MQSKFDESIPRILILLQICFLINAMTETHACPNTQRKPILLCMMNNGSCKTNFWWMQVDANFLLLLMSLRYTLFGINTMCFKDLILDFLFVIYVYGVIIHYSRCIHEGSFFFVKEPLLLSSIHNVAQTSGGDWKFCDAIQRGVTLREGLHLLNNATLNICNVTISDGWKWGNDVMESILQMFINRILEYIDFKTKYIRNLS